MSVLSGLYGRVAAWRRAWYGRHPQRRRVLARPVVSIGNLAMGGSGKTPAAAHVARVLQQMGERPAILSRGYARREPADGVVVVSDGARVLAPAARSGDEPQMLARALPGVPVLVAAERHLAGVLAERQFGATVHILDDGFQHLPLARDVDLLILSAADLDDTLLPAGRLREPLAAAAHADAVVVPGTDADVAHVAAQTRAAAAFRLAVAYEPLRAIACGGNGAAGFRQEAASELSGTVSHAGAPTTRAIAVAGIARPERFFAALRAAGVDIVGERVFRDHHWYTARDLDRLDRDARAADAVVVTTEKDAVRIAPRAGWFVLPMTVSIEPAAAFAGWLASRLADARARRGGRA